VSPVDRRRGWVRGKAAGGPALFFTWVLKYALNLPRTLGPKLRPDLRLERDGKPEPVDAAVAAGLMGPPLNFSELYAQFAQDIRTGARSVPDFAYASRMTRLLDAVSRAATSGTRQSGGHWPR
jgi:predicted dehydrogenase